MDLLKKLWDFLFGKKEDSVVLGDSTEEVDLNKIYDLQETVDHCTTHLRFRKHCPDCLRAVAAI